MNRSTKSNVPQVCASKHVSIDDLEVKKFTVNKDGKIGNYQPAYVSHKGVAFKFQLQNVNLILPATYSSDYKSYSLLTPLTEFDYETMTNIEQKIIELALPMCQEHVDKYINTKLKKGKEPITLTENDFTSVLRPADEEKNYAPSFSMRFTVNEETKEFRTILNDNNNKRLPFSTDNFDDYLKRNSIIDCILTCTLYRLNDKFGISWKPYKIRVVKEGTSGDVDFVYSDTEESQKNEDSDEDDVLDNM